MLSRRILISLTLGAAFAGGVLGGVITASPDAAAEGDTDEPEAGTESSRVVKQIGGTDSQNLRKVSNKLIDIELLMKNTLAANSLDA